MEYLGAFLLPSGREFTYTKGVKAYRPDGDPQGPDDGFPGSLFGTGHVHHPLVWEVNIPVPVNSRDPDDLHSAEILQEPEDIITWDIELKGLEYLPPQGAQTTPKLHYATGTHFQYDLNAYHGWFETNLSSPQRAGSWFVGDPNEINPLNTNEYIFTIPQEWADQYVPGKRLACGRFRGGQWSSGPTIIAFGPWNHGNPPPEDYNLDATPLLLYEYLACLCESCEGGGNGGNCLEGHCEDDEWRGGAWIHGERTAVAIVGVKGYGDCWYGYADGTIYSECAPNCPELGSRGYWSSYYKSVILLYNPDDLAAVARGELNADLPQPYEVVDIGPYLFGYDGELDRGKIKVAGTAYDSERGYLYITEMYGYDPRPVVHVWSVGGSPSEPDSIPPDPVTDLGATPGATGEVELTWTAPGDDGSSGRAIMYLVRRSDSTIDDEGAWSDATPVTGAPSPQTAGSSESMTVTGLQPETTYYFSVRARDDALNVGDLSNSPSVTTAADEDPPILINVSVEESEPGTLRFTWSTNEPATSEVRWDADYPGSGPLANTLSDPLLTIEHDLELSGLSAGSRIHYQVSSTDAAGNTLTDAIDYIDIQSTDTTPPGIIAGPSVSVDSSATMALISWRTDEPAVGWVEWGMTPSFGRGTDETTEYSTSHNHRLVGISHGQIIHFRVHVTDGSGNTTVSDADSFLVETDFDPPVVTDPVIVSTSSQTLLTFYTDEPSFGTLDWGVDPNDLSNSIPLASADQPAIMHLALLEGLSASTTYYWRLSLSDLSGNVTETEGDFLFSDGTPLDSTAPLAPDGLYIANFDEEFGVALQWMPNSENDLAGYEVHRRPIGEDGEPTGAWYTINHGLLTETAFLDDGVGIGLSYEYEVVARDVSSNESPPSESVEFDPEYWMSLQNLLGTPHPNPVPGGDVTRIDFRAPAVLGAESVRAEMMVYDVTGRSVRGLFRGLMTPGQIRTAHWNGRDRFGELVGNGIYFVRLQIADRPAVTRKVTVLR
jgi:hypothetical protein